MNRENNYISIFLLNIRYYYENLANCCSQYCTYFLILVTTKTLICKLDTVYRYIVYNVKTRLWPFYTPLKLVYDDYFISFIRAENHLYIKFV